MSVFLMGCYDPGSKCWCTVTKVHGGHDDDTLKRLQTELKMEKISKVRERAAGGVYRAGGGCLPSGCERWVGGVYRADVSGRGGGA